MDEWDWHRTLDVNLTGTFLMTQSVGRLMRSQASGVIINLITDFTGQADQSKAAFVTTMSGLAGFTQQAARELSPYGIQVYSVINDSENIVDTVFALPDLKMEAG
jgi:NAD(P)-dependent dehydrogenase (short-subunit alcohol dehydrogenase family)